MRASKKRRIFALVSLWFVITKQATGSGVEIFGNSNAVNGTLNVAFDVPVTAVPYEFLLGTYSYAGGTTPLGIAVPAGTLDSKITLFTGLSQLGTHDDLNGLANRDAELRSAGFAGRVGSTVIAPLPTNSYSATFGRFGVQSANAAYGLEMNNFFTVTDISKPGGDASFTINDVLVSNATLQLSGTALTANNGVTIESGGTFDVQGGSHFLDIVQVKNFCTMSMSGGTIFGSQLIAGNSGSGSINISNGLVSEQVIKLGLGAGLSGNLTQTGGSVYSNVSVNIGNATALPLSTYTLSGGVLNTGSVSLNMSGRMLLAGGTLSVENASSIVNPSGRFSWSSGTLEIRNATGPSVGLAALYSAGVNASTGQTLRIVYSNPVFDVPVTINGGALEVNDLSATAPVTLNSGRLALTDPTGFAIGTGTYFGDHLTLRPTATIAAMTFANTGLVDGNGTIEAALSNTGEVRADLTSTVRFVAATTSVNSNRLTLNGGRIEFTGALQNGTTGDIAGRGTLVASSVNNVGDIALSGGISDVYAPVTNVMGGRIIVSGNGDATFWGDVTNGVGGSIKVASGSSATFFGTYSGGGITGTGSVYFEADVTPGFSPAAVSIGGDVTFGSAARLVVELAGTIPGTQFDQLQVAGGLTLDGALDVALLGGFSPSAGQSFDVLDWSTLNGTFAALNLPTLAAGLAWNTSQLYTTGALSVVSIGVPGDYNNNSAVDAADYVLWRNGGPLTNEVDTPGVVNAADFAVWRARFGNASGSGVGVEIVPEPKSWVTISVLVCLQFLVPQFRYQKVRYAR